MGPKKVTSVSKSGRSSLVTLTQCPSHRFVRLGDVEPRGIEPAAAPAFEMALLLDRIGLRRE
jgi:hypothetical protein